MAETLIGNYRILSELARGSFGRVYLAQHAVLTNRNVALKLMQSVPLQAEEERAQFLHEARILEVLHHSYILPVIDVGLHDGVPYIVSEYAAQGSLRQRIRQVAPQVMPSETALKILCQIGQALHFVHQHNVIHRDLKPENILFSAKGDALLADFGLAAMLSTASMTFVSGAGTPHYMAPEQFQGIVSRESDQYALGCIAYELFTGQHLFAVNDPIALAFKHTTEMPLPPSAYNPAIPPHIEQAIMQALAKQREARHADVMSFLLAMVPSDQLQQAMISLLSSTSLNELPSSSSNGASLADTVTPVASASLMTPSLLHLASASLLRGNGGLDAMSTIISPTTSDGEDGNGGSLTVPMRTERGNALMEQTYLLPPQQATQFLPQSPVPVPVSPLPQEATMLLPQRQTLSGSAQHPRRRFLLVGVIALVLIALVTAVTLPSALRMLSHTNGNETMRSGNTVGTKHTPTAGGTQGTPQPGVTGNTPTAPPGVTTTPATTVGTTPTAGVTPTAMPTSGPSSTPNTAPPLGVNPTSLDASTSCGTYTAGQGWTCSLALSSSQSVSWSATINDPGSATGVTLSAASGTVGPGQPQTISLTVTGNTCPAQATVTFTSSANSVNVPVSCDAPTLEISPITCSHSLTGSSTCQTSITSSDAGFKWSATASGGTATFTPASGVYNPANGPLPVTITISSCSSISITFSFVGPGNTVIKKMLCAV